MNARVAFLCLALVAAAQAFAPTAPLALRSKSTAIATGLKLYEVYGQRQIYKV